MLRDSMEMRIEILKTLYRLVDKTPNKKVPVFPAQIEGYFYSDMKYELQVLKEKGFLDFTGSFISRKFQIALTDKGIQFMEDAYGILSLPDEIKQAALTDHFNALKL